MKTAKEHMEAASDMATLAASTAKDARTYTSLENGAERHGTVSQAASLATFANLLMAFVLMAEEEKGKI